MFNKLLGFIFFIFLFQITNAQLPTPEQFLGYTVGTRFTPHYKIVEYFKLIAAKLPSNIKIQEYGKTNEGRPLMVAFISSAENISNLEKIRQNNLQLAGLAGKRNQSSTNVPVVLWLSYNVHGNEAASSEAAMLVLYALADPENKQTKDWLKNTLVIIDPCINPDGRDRYVNWYNSIVGETANPNHLTREHQEPWPGGRSNHYNFDLNRDWAWQTQIESQQRLAIYNSWLPQVHVDYHEQGYNSPYYFAPAAEPYHEVVTRWQRDFQKTIGHNHARYFDKNGWLFFTKEEFDLLYPSYGDTYPIYNGAIGMTYEQGGIGAGLAVITNSGDTLTLYDRALHHFTTSLSTVEVCSQNAKRLIEEYRNYFNESNNSGIGIYKSYIVKYNKLDEQRIHSLTDLLQKNKIAYGYTTNESVHAYSYESNKDENIILNKEDLVIPALQPKSALIKVLFEPNASLSDSITYDITAWSVPYVYGVNAYASKSNLTILPSQEVKNINESINNKNDIYGYIIKWNGLPSVHMVSQLLQKGIKLRFNEQPFDAEGQHFERGSVIILKTSNFHFTDLWSIVNNLANENNISLTAVSSGFVEKGFDFGSSTVRPLKMRNVALVTGDGVSSTGAGEIWFYFEKLIGYPVSLINAADMNQLNWNNYDLVILPDGNYRYLLDKGNIDQLHNWINNGGHLIAIENAMAQLSKLDWGLKSKRTDDSDSKNIYGPLRPFEARDRDQVQNTTPGSIYRVELDNTHPLAFGFPKYYYTLKQDDKIYEYLKESGWNVGVIRKSKPISGFVGSKLMPHLQDGLLFGVQDIGRGSITYFADDILFRSFWENGKLLFSNAVFLVGQ